MGHTAQFALLVFTGRRCATNVGVSGVNGSVGAYKANALIHTVFGDFEYCRQHEFDLFRLNRNGL